MNDHYNYSALEKLLTPNVMREMAMRGYSRQFAQYFGETGLSIPFDGQATVADAFEDAFVALNVPGHRNAYVYRSVLLRYVLPQPSPVSLLTEFRVGDCKADLVVAADAATVYEIKSDRDNLSRLPKQIAQYRQFFPQVYVVSSEDHKQALIEILPETVGILCLNSQGVISPIRVARDDPAYLDPVTIFESLRLPEATSVLAAMGIDDLPVVPNTQRHTVMRNLFAELKTEDVYQAMTDVLRRRRDMSELAALQQILPPSLHAAILSMSAQQSSLNRLARALATPMDEALRWA